MDHSDILKQMYNSAYSLDDIQDFPEELWQDLCLIGEKCAVNKGVYTVLVTLITHKIYDRDQDIRYHQSNMAGGFSGRSIDTQYITPTLKRLGLPAMSESGWLTRSLEQPYPYDKNYNGKISGKNIKSAFLNSIDTVQHQPHYAEAALRILLHSAIISNQENKVVITPLDHPEQLTIANIIYALDQHFSYNYRTASGSKLPVLALYALYQILLQELTRYHDCELSPLGSHTASDRTSKTAGDIVIFKNDLIHEVIEVKYNKPINEHIVRIVYDKIKSFNPDRYYIFSNLLVEESVQAEITELVQHIKHEHGCQVVINGIIPTIQYYLRLISSLPEFINFYSNLIKIDTELKKQHKEKWNEIVQSINLF